MTTQPVAKLDSATLDFIEAFGQLVNEGGLPPSIGRVLGLLVISDVNKLSAEEISKLLQLSSGSVSSALNLLVQLGYVARVTVPGERRYYYTFDAGGWQQAITTRLVQVKRGIDLAQEGLQIRQHDPRLMAMRSLYDQLYTAIKKIRVEATRS